MRRTTFVLTTLAGLAPTLAQAQDAPSDTADATSSAAPQVQRPNGAGERSIYVDPTDGMFDVTAWLIQQRGFFPVPFIITEPALGGFGLGAGLVFLHGTPAQVEDPWTTDMKGERVLPPSVSVLFGGYTANDSWMAGVGHLGSYREDTIRYTGAAGYAQVNLDYFIGDTGFAYRIDGAFLLQDVLFRLAETPLFLGANYTLFSNEVAPREAGSGIGGLELDSTNAALGAKALYDTRDSIFTPNSGVQTELKVQSFNQAFGGDFDYWGTRLDARSWHPLGEDFVLGLRALGEWIGDDAPFYAQPAVTLRGIPMQRYQGQRMYTFDSELRYDLTQRWSVLGFVGVGGAYSDEVLRPDYDGIVAGGVGFRYLVGRPISARAGVDVGVGPESTAIYFQFGSGW